MSFPLTSLCVPTYVPPTTTQHTSDAINLDSAGIVRRSLNIMIVLSKLSVKCLNQFVETNLYWYCINKMTTINQLDVAAAYNNIKSQLLTLTNKPTEHFTLDLGEPTPEELEELKKRNIVPEEVYKVVEQFEKPPSTLSTDDKALRKKYLQILLDVINEQAPSGKEMTVMVPELYNNYDASVELIKRIINLMLSEIDKEVCPDYTPVFYTGLGVVVILLIIISVMYAVMKK